MKKLIYKKLSEISEAIALWHKKNIADSSGNEKQMYMLGWAYFYCVALFFLKRAHNLPTTNEIDFSKK